MAGLKKWQKRVEGRFICTQAICNILTYRTIYENKCDIHFWWCAIDLSRSRFPLVCFHCRRQSGHQHVTSICNNIAYRNKGWCNNCITKMCTTQSSPSRMRLPSKHPKQRCPRTSVSFSLRE